MSRVVTIKDHPDLKHLRLATNTEITKNSDNVYQCGAVPVLGCRAFSCINC